jgi:hypothetical protein
MEYERQCASTATRSTIDPFGGLRCMDRERLRTIRERNSESAASRTTRSETGPGSVAAYKRWTPRSLMESAL